MNLQNELILPIELFIGDRELGIGSAYSSPYLIADCAARNFCSRIYAARITMSLNLNGINLILSSIKIIRT